MKFDPLFKVNKNALFLLDDTKVDVNLVDIFDVLNQDFFNTQIQLEKNTNKINLFRLFVEQKSIELEPESYDEDFLAKLRDVLKILEQKNQFAVLNIIPGIDESTKDDICNNDVSSHLCEQYVACIKHCTRRIKDCTSLVGVEFNQDFIKNFSKEKTLFVIDELYKKHSHYIYFVKKEFANKLNSLDNEYLSKVCFL